jgi:cysteine desulfurase
MDQDVLLVSVMAVNNEVGSINDIAAVAEHVKPHGAFYHVDAAQAPVAMDTSDFALDADLISLSAHKMYGPQGIGALYVGHDMHEALVPQIYGGGQQTGLRSGTVPVALVAGMAEAARLVMEEGEDIRRHLSVLKERLWAGIQNNIPDAVLNGARFDIRHPGNLNIQIPSVVAQDLVLALQPGLACSTGSACTSGIQEPSHVLRAMGLSSVEAGASLRLSVGRSNACEDVDRAVEYIVGTIEKIRSSDPVADIA